MSSLLNALTRSFRTTPGMIHTRAARDRANPAHAAAELEAIPRRSSEVTEILMGTIIGLDQGRQVLPTGAPLVIKEDHHRTSGVAANVT